MAIAGLVVIPSCPETGGLKARLLGVQGLSYFGSAPDGGMVYVLEAHSGELEERLRVIARVEGVGAVLPASVNIEDEMDGG